MGVGVCVRGLAACTHRHYSPAAVYVRWHADNSASLPVCHLQDAFGDRSRDHPELPTFLQQLVETLNSGVSEAAAAHAAAIAGGCEQFAILSAVSC